MLKIGVNSDGTYRDERKTKTVTKWALDERSGKESKTSGQTIPIEAVDYVIARLKSTSGGSATGTKEARWTQCVVGVRTDQAGHVIANSWGGSGKLADGNLFPQFATINQGDQSAFEKRVKNAIGKKDVCVIAMLNYSESDTVYPARPITVHYAIYIDGIEEKLEYNNDVDPDAYKPESKTGRQNYCRKLPY